jgi:hypothetical protein
MIQFPLDPTPYMIPYVIIVFLAPWMISASYIIRELRLAYRSGVLGELMVLPPSAFRARRDIITRFFKTNTEVADLHKRLVRWCIVTIAAWVFGFLLLGAALFWMDQNDFMINHSMGLHGPGETPPGE